MKHNLSILKMANVWAFVFALTLNYVSVSLPLNGKTPRELSDALPNLFVPAPVTFSIWGVIYLLMIGFLVWQYRNVPRYGQNERRDRAIDALGWRPSIGFLLNGLWLVCWHFQWIGLSVLVMAAYLTVLILIVIELSRPDFSAFSIPKWAFGANLGWICVATIANVTAFLVSKNWRDLGFPEPMIAAAMALNGAAIAFLAVRKWRQFALGFAVVWALFGIYLARKEDERMVAFGAVFSILIVGAGLLLEFFKKEERPLQSKN